MGEAKRKAMAPQPVATEDWLSATTAGPKAVQPVSGAIGPVDETAVSPEEQEQYEDFVSRAIHFVNDTRVPQKGARSPADAVLERMNQRGLTVPEALGGTTADVVFMIHNNAKRQGVEYEADVLWHGADEIMSQLLDLGRASGVFPKLPPENSEEEQKLLGAAKAEAAKAFGEKLIATGQAPQAEAQAFMQEQMQREADSGELDDWDPLSSVSPDALTQALKRAQGGGAEAPDMMAHLTGAGLESLQ